MINVTFDAPKFMDINRGKLDRLVLLAAYQIHESTGSLIDRLEEKHEGRAAPKRGKTRAKAGRSRG